MPVEDVKDDAGNPEKENPPEVINPQVDEDRFLNRLAEKLKGVFGGGENHAAKPGAGPEITNAEDKFDPAIALQKIEELTNEKASMAKQVQALREQQEQLLKSNVAAQERSILAQVKSAYLSVTGVVPAEMKYELASAGCDPNLKIESPWKENESGEIIHSGNGKTLTEMVNDFRANASYLGNAGDSHKAPAKGPGIEYAEWFEMLNKDSARAAQLFSQMGPEAFAEMKARSKQK